MASPECPLAIVYPCVVSIPYSNYFFFKFNFLLLFILFKIIYKFNFIHSFFYFNHESFHKFKEKNKLFFNLFS